MAEPAETFLGRWSRLKRDAAVRQDAPAEALAAEVPGEEVEDEAHRPAAPAAPTDATVAGFDPASLPSLAELGAESDYTSFLAPEVPEELRRLALRKAWATDTAIAGFRGFADYDWDFNAPGYGKLLPTDDVKALCDALFDTGPGPGPARPAGPPPEEAPVAGGPGETVAESLPAPTEAPLGPSAGEAEPPPESGRDEGEQMAVAPAREDGEGRHLDPFQAVAPARFRDDDGRTA